MNSDNAHELPQVVAEAGKLGVKELIISSSRCPEKQQLIQAAEFINNLKDIQITLTVDSCFSPLRAIMGG